MDNERCSSHKSLSTVHRWLLEGGDGSLSVVSRSTTTGKVKRKRLQVKREQSKRSLIDWFYTCVKQIFTIYDQMDVDERSISSLSSPDETTDPYRHFYERLFPSLQSDFSSISTEDRSASRLFSKATQTQPIYCFSLKDGQALSSIRCSTIPTKEETTSISSSLVDRPSCPGVLIDIPSLVISSSPSIDQSGYFKHTSSLTRTYHFDQRNCLLECRHSSSDEQQTTERSSCHAPEVIFAQSTCQLIKQAWSPSPRGR